MAPQIIAAIISAVGSAASSYLQSRNRQPGPLGGPGGAQSGYTPVSSSVAADAIKQGSDVLSQAYRQKAEEEERKRKEEELRKQQAAAQTQQSQSVGQMYAGQRPGGLRGALEAALSRALGF